MEPFALSVPAYRRGLHPSKPARKQEEDAADTQATSTTTTTKTSQFSSSSIIINPLSHTPDTLHQFSIAGLSAEEDVPSKKHPGFPHKPLPESRQRRPTHVPESGTPIRYSARIRHLNTMTAIMHRCLREGDIIRAKRALGLLLRTKDIDLRLGNLWTIGSEILMRDGTGADEDNFNFNSNFSRVKTYLELLIQQHPHDTYRPYLTSAVDFWPALFGIEVYTLHVEYRRALQRIDTEYGSMDMDLDLDLDLDDEEEDSPPTKQEEQEEKHEEIDALRAETRRGALELATRMDGVLENAPYTTHAEILRLRAHVSLFVADLFLPSRLLDRWLRRQGGEKREEEQYDYYYGQERKRRHMSRSLRDVVRTPEERGAVASRREEQEKARRFFERVLAAKGRLEEWVMRFLDNEEEDE
ncbi:hypothetical protein GGS20DRAFT_292330 [Poronia punctata]|nr:hypothetical protein GGS20DRAFT_292330 [Poronia punctata]